MHKPEMVLQLEETHQMDQWYQNEMITFDLNLVFGGKKRFKGTISMTPNGGLVRMEDSSKTMIWNGEEAFIYPDTISYKRARFDLLTWSYFFAAAYKLSDPGTNHSMIEDRKLDGLNYPSFKLTFGEGVGDSPDDWYIVYQDRETKLLSGMAYIVTYSSSVEEEEEDPHLITYSNYQNINLFPIAMNWKFWTWDESGAMDRQLGEASISNVEFTGFSEELFIPDSSFKLAGK